MSSTALLTHAQALFYILALNVFHIYYALHTATRRTYLALREWYVGPLASCTAPTPDTVRADTERLSKIPRHLAVLVINEEGGASRCDEELVQDVVKLACYCSAAGIVELTVYEATGSLKLQHAHLNKEVFAARRRWESYVVERKSFAEVNVQNAPKPLSVPAVKLNVFSAEDGIGHIVEMTQSLSNAAQSGALSSKDIDINLVDKFLRKQDLTEPNLMIVIGGTPHKYVSLEGFPPWHVRLTEIVNMSGHDRIDYTLFLRSLYRYSKVEQRFGR